jgi:hypothetical protein
MNLTDCLPENTIEPKQKRQIMAAGNRRKAVMRMAASCLILSACGFGTAGTTQDSGTSAPKTIRSTELVSAEIRFDDSGRTADDPETYAMHPPGFYQLSLKKSGQGAVYHAVCTRGSIDGETIIDLQFTADAAALAGLERLIRDKGVAAVNGIARTGTAVKGTTVLDAVYASGEEIHGSAEGGAGLPADFFQTDWFVDYFRRLAEENGREFCNPLIAYADAQSSRVLPEAEITGFDLSCEHSAEEEPGLSWPAGHYSMKLEKENGAVLCSLTYRKNAASQLQSTEFTASPDAFAQLKELMRERDTAMLNGYQRMEDTKVTQLWLQADFASGESVFATAQGLTSSVKPYVYYEDSWYLDFFQHLAEQQNTGFPF